MHVGIDMVKIDRIHLDKRFIEKVLTVEEINDYSERHKKKEFLAGRLALKEAIIKTFDGKETVLMNEIHIDTNSEGVPICNYKKHKIIGSISHDGEYAVAVAIRME